MCGLGINNDNRGATGQIAASAKSQAAHEGIMRAVESRDGMAIATALREHRESA